MSMTMTMTNDDDDADADDHDDGDDGDENGNDGVNNGERVNSSDPHRGGTHRGVTDDRSESSPSSTTNL